MSGSIGVPPRRNRFNGAGMFLSRKSRGGFMPASRSPRFNGAGMFLSRKCDQLYIQFLRADGLQWGRDVSILEIFNPTSETLQAVQLQWGRDVSIPEIVPHLAPRHVRRRLQWGRDVSIQIGRASCI